MPKRKVDWFGPRLRELRESKGMTQAELGRLVNLAGSQINKLESNISQPIFGTVLDLARALAVDLNDFVPEGAETIINEPVEPIRRPKGRPPKADVPPLPGATKAVKKPKSGGKPKNGG